MTKVNYLVIGYGYWGPNVARNIYKSKISNLTAIVDNDKKAIKKAINDNYSDNYIEKLEDLDGELLQEVDIIVITTPPKTHFQIIKRLYKYNKIFLSAKPICTSLDELSELEKIIKENNVEIFIDNTYLYSNKVREIKKIVNSKSFGEINYISSVRSNLGIIQEDIDVIWDLAPHDLSIVTYITGNYPISSKALSNNSLQNMKTQNNFAYVEFKYKKFNFYLNVNWLAPEKIRYMVFSGTNQTLVYDDNKKINGLRLYNQSIERDEKSFIYNLDKGKLVNYKFNEPLYDEITQISNYVLNNSLKPISTLQNSIKNIIALSTLERM